MIPTKYEEEEDKEKATRRDASIHAASNSSLRTGDSGSGYSEWKRKHPIVPRPEDLLFAGLPWLARAAAAALSGKLNGSDE